MEPFTFIQMHYNYAYTSNGHQHDMVKRIGQLLGVEDIPQREWVMPEEWKIKTGEINKEARDLIITNMCYTYRHDYGLEKDIGNGFISELSAGMTNQSVKHYGIKWRKFSITISHLIWNLKNENWI